MGTREKWRVGDDVHTVLMYELKTTGYGMQTSGRAVARLCDTLSMLNPQKEK